MPDNQLQMLPKEHFNVFQANAAIFSVSDCLRTVRQTFHMHCPQCCADNVINNGNPQSTVFKLDRFGRLTYTCTTCKSVLDLPIKFE